MGAIPSDAVVVLDGDGVSWWTSRQRERDPAVVWCGSLKAWAVLQAEAAEGEARWLGPLGPAAWRIMEHRLDDWHRALADIPSIGPHAPVTADLAELLTGDLATPALISLALVPLWTRQLASCSRVTIPVGRHFRPPRFSRLGDLPLLVLASSLERAGTPVRLVRELDPPSGEDTPSAGEGWRVSLPRPPPGWPSVHCDIRICPWWPWRPQVWRWFCWSRNQLPPFPSCSPTHPVSAAMDV